VTGDIPLARPVIGEREEQAVGASQASAVSSGTAGLHLALRALGVGRDHEVITTPFSFVASANVAVYEGARPVFADIDPVTLNLDPAAAAAAVTPRTAAVLAVHVFGYPADIPALEKLGLPMLEDACEALGAIGPDGRRVGGGRHPAVFGFYANKQMTTGEGGMITTADPALKERLDSERNQGRAPDLDWLDHDRLGFNYRLSEIACALGLAQLERLEELLAERRRVASAYREALAGIDGLDLPCPDDGATRRGWFVFVVQLPRDADRDGIVHALGARGVASKPYFPAIHLMSYYRRRFGHREGQFPVCEDVAARSIALPFFPAMTEGQVERVAEALREVLGR
jgi:perosamine synthetase